MPLRQLNVRPPPAAYERLIERVEPGGMILVVGCRKRWPVTSVGERHLFQFGAPGGATVAEYHEGGPRVEGLLAPVRVAPATVGAEPDGEAARPNGGFDDSLLEDVATLAERRGLRLHVLSFDEPDRMSPGRRGLLSRLVLL